MKINTFDVSPGPTLEVFRVAACAIRNYGAEGGYWQPIADEAHAPVNIASVLTTVDEIVVTYRDPSEQTVTCSVTTDETLSSLGYVAGARVGRDKMRVWLSRNGLRVDPQTVMAEWGNIWILYLGT